MQIEKLKIENYKSLRDLNVNPQNLTVLVGANASGKSNFADCLDFISETYRHGLEFAIAHKGGYDSIAHRKQRRSRGSIIIEISASYNSDATFINKRASQGIAFTRHSFAFGTKALSIKADFRVERESLDVSVSIDKSLVKLFNIQREENNIQINENREAMDKYFGNVEPRLREFYFGLNELRFFTDRNISIPPTELFISRIGRFSSPIKNFVEAMENVRVFQISPSVSREFGVPTPGPELNRDGANLPAVIDLLKKQRPKHWSQIVQAMTRILPDLEDIEIDYTTSRTLGLFFREKNTGRPWSVAEVSDGTIQTLALLVAIFDTRSTALVLEEPENSVHPWIIRNLIDACKEASKTKQIIMTTHSPIVVNSLNPDQVWVIWRSHGESHVAPLLSLDESFKEMWEAGQVSTFDFLDSGAVSEAIPSGPNL